MHALVFSLCCLKKKKKKENTAPEDLIPPGCSNAVQSDRCISEGGFIALGEAHHFLGNAMKEAAGKCLWGCPVSSCPPVSSPRPPQLSHPFLCLLFLSQGSWGPCTSAALPRAAPWGLAPSRLSFGDLQNPLKLGGNKQPQSEI